MIKKLHMMLSILGLFLALSLPSFADEWADLATISATTTTNHLCHFDGTDIVCAAPGDTVIISGDVSATTLNATQVCDESGANCKDVSGGWGNATSLNDADGNTLVQVEESPNEDKVRIDTGSVERVVIDAAGVSVTGAVSATTNIRAPLVKLTPISGSAGLDTTLTETDPTIGTLTANKWCQANGAGDEIVCSTDDPTISALDDIGDVDLTGAATNNLLQFNGTNWVDTASITVTDVTASGTVAAASVSATTDVTTPIMNLTPVAGGSGYTESVSLTEDDPQVGALTANKWCVANGSGSAIVCSADDPTSNPDAATLDSLDSLQFVRSDASDSLVGDYDLTGSFTLDQNASATGLQVTGGGGGNPLAVFSRDVGGNGTVSITAGSNDPQIVFNPEDAGQVWSMGVDDSDSDSFVIASETSLASGGDVTITSTGNVGVGTNDPNAELHVNGAVQVAGNASGCSSAGDIGKIKFNSDIGKFQICRP